MTDHFCMYGCLACLSWPRAWTRIGSYSNERWRGPGVGVRTWPWLLDLAGPEHGLLVRHRPEGGGTDG